MYFDRDPTHLNFSLSFRLIIRQTSVNSGRNLPDPVAPQTGYGLTRSAAGPPRAPSDLSKLGHELTQIRDDPSRPSPAAQCLFADQATRPQARRTQPPSTAHLGQLLFAWTALRARHCALTISSTRGSALLRQGPLVMSRYHDFFDTESIRP